MVSKIKIKQNRKQWMIKLKGYNILAHSGAAKPPPFLPFFIVLCHFYHIVSAVPPSRLSDGTDHWVLYILVKKIHNEIK